MSVCAVYGRCEHYGLTIILFAYSVYFFEYLFHISVTAFVFVSDDKFYDSVRLASEGESVYDVKLGRSDNPSFCVVNEKMCAGVYSSQMG